MENQTMKHYSTVNPLAEVIGKTETGELITFCDILSDPFQGWGKVKFFTRSGALAFLAARAYDRKIPAHPFFSIPGNQCITDTGEVRSCH